MNDLFSFANIYRCYLKCRRRKRKTINALRFEMRLESGICKLEKELKTKSYRPARSVCFVVKKPKFREIFAADFKDRIVHHILVDYLEKIFEPKFIYDSWACRRGKGTIAAVKRLRKFTRSITLNGTRNAYYLQLDIKSFFVNINKGELFKIIKKKTDNRNILWLLKKILDNDCVKDCILKGNPRLIEKIPPHKTLFKTSSDKGLPIGNLTSQFFANVYLNELDQFVKHFLKIKYYARYVDDFVILSQDKEKLFLWKKEIENFLSEKLKLELNPKMEKLKLISNGIDFLGYIIRPEYMLVRRRVVNNCRSKLRGIAGNVGANQKILQFSPELVKKTKESFSSYLAHFKYANSYKAKQSIISEFAFLNDYYKYFNLVLPHNFSCLENQYEFFRNKLSGKNRLFFQVGCFYKFFGEDAINAGKIFGLKIIKKGEKHFAGFQIGFERKYADLAVKSGYNVYVINQAADVFAHNLRVRVLTKGYNRDKPTVIRKSIPIFF